MYTASQVEFFQNSDPAAFGGDGKLVKAQGTDNQILYSWTHMTDIAVKAYVKAGTLTAEVSQDGEAFQPLTLAANAGETDAGGYQAVTFTADTLPENTNYVRLHLGEDVAIGEVTLRYQPANMPIQKVRFTDSALDGIIAYDTVPEIRVAPMNGTGQLEYAVLNENLATFDGGTLSFHAQGTTRAVVTAIDSGATAELPLTIYKNLALKQTASASSSHNLYPPRMGVDGDLSSGWQSGAQEAEWYAVDLGAPVTFDAVDIVWSSKGQAYVIETSDDGQSYTPIVTVTDANAGGGREVVRHTLDTPRTARYVRMRGVTPYQYSITECCIPIMPGTWLYTRRLPSARWMPAKPP